jgi:hypothetical protein
LLIYYGSIAIRNVTKTRQSRDISELLSSPRFLVGFVFCRSLIVLLSFVRMVVGFTTTYVVGFTTTYAISAYHHWCESESRSRRVVQHYVIKFVNDLWQVCGFLWVLWFSLGSLVSSTNKTDRHDIKLKYCWKWR